MLHNLPLKIFALVLAAIFWFFIVSLESRFVNVPGSVPIKVFNVAPQVALSSQLGSVKIGVRVQDPLVARTLKPEDFEAYVDLKDAGVGKSTFEVAVSSKNPQVSVVRIEPRSVEVELEPVREKLLKITPKIVGSPKNGFRLDSIVLAPQSITAEGAESLLKRVARSEAVIRLEGLEDTTYTIPKVKIIHYDSAGAAIDGLILKDASIQATINISESQLTKQIGVRAKFTGALANGVVQSVEVTPSVLNLIGDRDPLMTISTIETEPIDLSKINASFERDVKIQFPAGVNSADGITVVNVKVIIGN